MQRTTRQGWVTVLLLMLGAESACALAAAQGAPGLPRIPPPAQHARPDAAGSPPERLQDAANQDHTNAQAGQAVHPPHAAPLEPPVTFGRPATAGPARRPMHAPAHISLTVGGRGVLHYERSPEVLGPTAVDAADDGTFWIIDAVARRVVHVNDRGTLLDSLTVPGSGATSIAVTSNAVYVLGFEAGTPRFYHLTHAGRVLTVLPADPGATALLRDGERVWVQAESLHEYDASNQVLRQDATASARSVKPCVSDAEAGPQHCLEVTLARRHVRFAVRENLQGVRVARSLPDGSLMIEVALMSSEGAPDSQLWHVAADGTLLGKARFSRDGATFVEQPLAIRATGEAYALVTATRRAALHKLTFEPDLTTISLAPQP